MLVYVIYGKESRSCIYTTSLPATPFNCLGLVFQVCVFLVFFVVFKSFFNALSLGILTKMKLAGAEILSSYRSVHTSLGYYPCSLIKAN